MSAAPSKLGGLTRVRRSESTIRICKTREEDAVSSASQFLSFPVASLQLMRLVHIVCRDGASRRWQGEAHLVSGLEGDGTLTAFLLDDPSCDIASILVRNPDPVVAQSRGFEFGLLGAGTAFETDGIEVGRTVGRAGEGIVQGQRSIARLKRTLYLLQSTSAVCTHGPSAVASLAVNLRRSFNKGRPRPVAIPLHSRREQRRVFESVICTPARKGAPWESRGAASRGACTREERVDEWELTICERSTLRARLGRGLIAVLIVFACASQPSLALTLCRSESASPQRRTLLIGIQMAFVMTEYNCPSIHPPPLRSRLSLLRL
jgi:hypothetical protein